MQSLTFSNTVRQNDTLRAAFNDLTRATFGFDFSDWYSAGHWGELYIPHVLTDGKKVVSNISVNLMRFRIDDVDKNYIQLGTVMTDQAYRNQGLNRSIMERILAEYRDQVDGIYLFANDSVLNYYPKYGFRPVTETEYFLTRGAFSAAQPYTLLPVAAEALYEAVSAGTPNPNDGMYMSENLGLYQFWCTMEFSESIYRIPELDALVVADAEDGLLRIHQVIGSQSVDLFRLAASFGTAIQEVVFGFTPGDRAGLSSRPHKEEDTTLFILGDDLNRIEADGLLFPTFSHA